MDFPLYQCHKRVRAAKIIAICGNQLKLEIPAERPNEIAYQAIEPVSIEFLRKHSPQVGGYYVVYEDGYISYSPEKAFEDGYKQVRRIRAIEIAHHQV